MYEDVIKYLWGSIPLYTLAFVIFSLVFVGSVELVQIDYSINRQIVSRIIILLAIYFLILALIIQTYLKILKQRRSIMRCTPQRSNKIYSEELVKNTQRELSKLYASQSFQNWKKEKDQINRSNIVYEILSSSDSENEIDEVRNCHRLATMKKLF